MFLGKLFGVVLCLLSLGLTALFAWGLVNQTYWAIAIPAGGIVIFAMAMLFWVGWTFIMTKLAPMDEPQDGQSPRTRRQR